MEQKQNVYRAMRRNAARKAGILNLWRFRPRISTGLYGERSRQVAKLNAEGERVVETITFRVYTYVVGAYVTGAHDYIKGIKA